MAGQTSGQSDTPEQGAEGAKTSDAATNGEDAGEDTDGDDDDMMDRISSEH